MKRSRSPHSEESKLVFNKKEQLMRDERIDKMMAPMKKNIRKVIDNIARHNCDHNVYNDIKNIIFHYTFHFSPMLMFPLFYDPKLQSYVLKDTASCVKNMNDVKKIYEYNLFYMVFHMNNGSLKIMNVRNKKMTHVYLPEFIPSIIEIRCFSWSFWVWVKIKPNMCYFGEIDVEKRIPALTVEPQYYPDDKAPLDYVETEAARGIITMSHQWVAQYINKPQVGWEDHGQLLFSEHTPVVDHVIATEDMFVGWTNKNKNKNKNENKNTFWWLYLNNWDYEHPKQDLKHETCFTEKSKAPILVDGYKGDFIVVNESNELYFRNVKISTQTPVYYAHCHEADTIYYLDKDGKMYGVKRNNSVSADQWQDYEIDMAKMGLRKCRVEGLRCAHHYLCVFASVDSKQTTFN